MADVRVSTPAVTLVVHFLEICESQQQEPSTNAFKDLRSIRLLIQRIRDDLFLV